MEAYQKLIVSEAYAYIVVISIRLFLYPSIIPQLVRTIIQASLMTNEKITSILDTACGIYQGGHLFFLKGGIMLHSVSNLLVFIIDS